MRWPILVVVAACSGREQPVLVDARLDLNVLWTPEVVVVYAREPDRPCTCLDGEFPALGACAEDEDVLMCTCDPPPAVCLTSLQLRDGGTVVTTRQGLQLGGQVFLPGVHGPVADPTLEIDGCDTHVELHIAPSGPVPQIAATRVGMDHVEVSWTTDRPAARAFAMASTGFVTTTCQTTTDRVTLPGGGTLLTTDVFTTDLPVELVTPLGLAHMFVGHHAFMMVP